MKKIPPFKLIPRALDEAAEEMKPFQWAGSEIGKRHQLGGEPAFIQGTEVPSCPSCERDMSFYAQLDSINDDVILGDCGMIYVFVCFDCLETKSLLQSY